MRQLACAIPVSFVAYVLLAAAGCSPAKKDTPPPATDRFEAVLSGTLDGKDKSTPFIFTKDIKSVEPAEQEGVKAVKDGKKVIFTQLVDSPIDADKKMDFVIKSDGDEKYTVAITLTRKPRPVRIDEDLIPGSVNLMVDIGETSDWKPVTYFFQRGAVESVKTDWKGGTITVKDDGIEVQANKDAAAGTFRVEIFAKGGRKGALMNLTLTTPKRDLRATLVVDPESMPKDMNVKAGDTTLKFIAGLIMEVKIDPPYPGVSVRLDEKAQPKGSAVRITVEPSATPGQFTLKAKAPAYRDGEWKFNIVQ